MMIRLFLRIQQNTCSSSVEIINFFDQKHLTTEFLLIKKIVGGEKLIIVVDREITSNLKEIASQVIPIGDMKSTDLSQNKNICFFLSTQKQIQAIIKKGIAFEIHLVRHEGDFNVNGETVDCDCPRCLMGFFAKDKSPYHVSHTSEMCYHDGNQYTLITYSKSPTSTVESKLLKPFICKLALKEDIHYSASFFSHYPKTSDYACEAPEKISQNAYDSFLKMGKPKYFCAPMIGQSELAFRMLVREHGGVDICYTPMSISALFLGSEEYRNELFSTCERDRPLVVQFASHDPLELLSAAKMVERHCDAIDINLGCPQPTGRRNFYGAWLMEDWRLIYNLIITLRKNLTIPVWCKIRIYESFDKTIAYAKMIESAGCSLLTVHGRLRQCAMNDQPANWEYIKGIKQALHIPVVANGSVTCLKEAKECLAITGCDGVMAASGILVNPLLFSTTQKTAKEVALLYLTYAKKYKALLRYAIPHVLQILGQLTIESENAIKASQSIEALGKAVIASVLEYQKAEKSAFNVLFDSQPVTRPLMLTSKL